MRTVSSAPSTGKCKKVQVRDFLIEVFWLEVDIETSTRSHRDERGGRDDLLRLDVVDLQAFKAF